MTRCWHAPSLSLMFMFWFATDSVVALANWWFCISQLRYLDKSASAAHGVLSVFGFLMYFGVASPLFYYPHYYRERLRMWDKLVNRPQGRKEFGRRTWRSYTILAIWVSFLSAFPRFCVELHFALNYGWFYVLQGTSVLTSFVTTFCGFLAVWGSYLWKASKRFQVMSLNTMRRDDRAEYLAAYKDGPFEFLNDDLGEPMWVSGMPLPTFITSSPFYTFYPDATYPSPQEELAAEAAFHGVPMHPTGLSFPAQDPDLPVYNGNPLTLKPPAPSITTPRLRGPPSTPPGDVILAASDITFVD